MASAGLSGPIAFGTFQPTIGLPERFDFNPAQREAMLAHELAHLAAHDPLWHLLVDTVSAALWWHPLVWWMRHQLHTANESAADEASLLINDGPGALAECLVELGARVPRRAPLGWMRIEGNGFRSGLGRRVERLLKLDGGVWQPRARFRVWLAKTIGPALLVAVGIVGTAWTQPGEIGRESSIRRAVEKSWRHSLASSALLAVLGTEAAADAQPTNRPDTDTKSKPTEVTAQTLPQEQTSNPPDWTDRNLLRIGPGRESIMVKLDRIKFQETPKFDGMPLSAIVDWLQSESRKLDRDNQGINFFFVNHLDNDGGPPGAVPQLDPRTGKPFAQPPQEAADLESITVKLPVLHDIRLADVIDALSKAADKPIKYSVEEYAVVFSRRTPEPYKLYTRTYKVDPNTFLEALRRFGEQLPNSGQPGQTNHSTAGVADVMPLLRPFFSSLGVNIPTNAVDLATSNQQKAVYFNERTGVLFVRATQMDLDIIDQALQVLNLAPPQIVIEAKFTEMTEPTVKELGFDFPIVSAPAFQSRTATNSPTAGLPRQQTNAVRSPATLTGILTDPQFRAVIRALEQRSGIDILSTPRVTTLSGRQAQVQALEMRTVVTGVELEALEKNGKADSTKAPRVRYKTSPMGFGPTVTVLPTVKPDGYTIQMELKGTMKDFLGYDDPREVKVRELSAQYQEPLPRYRTREISGNVIVQDGQTVVLGGTVSEDVLKVKDKVPVLGDIPWMGRLFRRESTSTVKKRLMIFITPTIVDPAGNRVHASDGLRSYDPNKIPPQPAR
jgi:type II secretory pathway component GspD/PulD (secretin)